MNEDNMSDTQENRAEGEAAAAPTQASKPLPKPAAPVKKPASAPVADKPDTDAAASAPAPVAAPAKKVEPIAGLGGYKPVVDSDGRLHLSAQFFTDPHVSAYPVRRFDGDVNPPYVMLPGNAGEVAIRTGVVIQGGFESFVATPPAMGEVLVTNIVTRHGELYLVVRPYGAGAATVVEGKVLAVLELSND